MEVATPLSFVNNGAGSKRSLAFSPGIMDSTNRSLFDASDEYGQKTFKRRRFNADVSMDGESENTLNQASSFPMHSNHSAKNLFPSSPAGQSNFKRCRTEALGAKNDLQRVVQSQAAEIDGLQHEKVSLTNSLDALKEEHAKVVNENKILKKAVTIQQERQNHAAAEIEAARRYKVDADGKIKQLEQIIYQLRYHLQAQQSNASNDFMGFPPRHPDVF
eukprot:Nitzschia sp. Nitz4//scaffold232_size35869//21134//21924//NITZ4_007808-RA/size35869-processed-gene-0.61-mRNA-1//1//CDS//3329543333//5472//frame0